MVDPGLAQRLKQRSRVSYAELQTGSVQIWAKRIAQLRLSPMPGRREVYCWPYAYDSGFLGYMAGVLQQADFAQQGFAFV